MATFIMQRRADSGDTIETFDQYAAAKRAEKLAKLDRGNAGDKPVGRGGKAEAQSPEQDGEVPFTPSPSIQAELFAAMNDLHFAASRSQDAAIRLAYPKMLAAMRRMGFTPEA
jgi:hypothetical protein